MTTSQERRARRRVSLSLPLAVYGDDDNSRLLMLAHTVDVSTAGALVHGAGRVQVGQRVRVEVARGAARNPLGLAARVVRVADPAEGRPVRGAAMAFTDLTALDEALLARIIEDR